jgi:ABC-2 type transport system ATP-binding protein
MERTMKDPIIEVRNFRKVYGDVVAVEEASFEVHQGEIFGLLGPNGAGKTTILESLEGLRQPDGGSLRVAGIDPVRQDNQLRDLIGVQLQSGGLPETLSVEGAMRFFCAYHGVPPRPELLERLGLGQKRKAQYYQLSTGLKRRLTLAIAMIHNPPVLILDEPTAGLDVPSRAELHNLLRELQAAGTTILLATHDMAEAEALADRVAILLHGEIVTIGTPLDITATGSGLTKISIYTKENSLAHLDVTFPAVQQKKFKDNYMIYYSRDISPTLTALITHIESSGDILVDLRVARPSLEERFLEITNGGGIK